MADKSYSPIVHQNNQPVSAVANNDSVPPQYDTAAKTAASNTPPVADNGSTEANAEPATFRAFQSLVTNITKGKKELGQQI